MAIKHLRKKTLTFGQFSDEGPSTTMKVQWLFLLAGPMCASVHLVSFKWLTSKKYCAFPQDDSF